MSKQGSPRKVLEQGLCHLQQKSMPFNKLLHVTEHASGGMPDHGSSGNHVSPLSIVIWALLELPSHEIIQALQ
jgi:hypothetical protein